jgi:hypothetical protein
LLLTLLDSTGIINEGVKAVYDTIGRIKGTRLKHDEIAEYVGDKNSNLDVSDIYRISKESLDMMIADKKAEEKSAIFAQYRQEVFISNVSYYGSAFLGQILDPIVLLAGVGWSISKVKTAPN